VVLRPVLEVGGTSVVHCCAASPPVELLRRAGAAAVSLDATLLTPRDDDALGEAVEAGCGLFLGVVPSSGVVPSDLSAATAPITTLWRRLGLPAEDVSRSVVVTPTCGLAGASTAGARRALEACVEAARRLPDDVEVHRV
jgi:hypothetical protein